jgi:two-component system CheB/CheR fusion protein
MFNPTAMKKEVQSTNPAKFLQNENISSSEFYSQLIDSLQDYSIFTIDNDLKVNSWNQGAAKIFGYEAADIVGKNFEVLFTEEDRIEGVPKKEAEIAQKDGRSSDNRYHLQKNGNKFYSFGLLFPLVGTDGVRYGYVKVLRDLTERKKAEDIINKYVKELEELNAHKESVISILSHDLRSPLTGIVGSVNYLKTNLEKMALKDSAELVDHLSKATKDELDMLDYLVEWARIKFASEIFAPSKLDLYEHVQKVFDVLNETASVHTINLHNEVEENTGVFADKKMLLSILQNIISNAIKYSLSGGAVSVKAKREEDKIIIEIKDSGLGMSREIQDKLFVPQLGILSKERKKNKGAGIGLLLVKSLLEKSGGEIWVESVEGLGSSFYFTLPIYKIDNPEAKAVFDAGHTHL